MATMTVKDMQRLLVKNGANLVRNGDHQVYKLAEKTFSLPINHRVVSPGVVRQAFKFLGVKGN